jgi:subtilisin family serine protease
MLLDLVVQTHTVQAAEGPGNYVPNQVVVRLAPPLLGSVTTLANSIAANFGLRVLDRLDTLPIFRLQIVNNLLSPPALATLLDNIPGVLYAEPNYIGEPPEGVARYSWFKGGDAGEYHEQWAPDAIRLPEAHAVVLGAGVTVAVLDTGVDLDHPALAGHLVQGFDFVDVDSNPSEGGTQDALCCIAYGHGTHVAGLVALAAPEAKIMPLRVLRPDGRGDLWLLAQAVRYAVGLPPAGVALPASKADVINISYSVSQRSFLIDDLLGLVGQLPGGPVVVAAAGNNGPSTAYEYPAAEGQPTVLAVAASTQTDSLADFSTCGSWVDLAAPGEDILSSVPDDEYGTWSGTSMATPLVAGTAALVRARYPNLSAAQVAARIVSESAPIAGPVPHQLDAAQAVGLSPASP